MSNKNFRALIQYYPEMIYLLLLQLYIVFIILWVLKFIKFFKGFKISETFKIQNISELGGFNLIIGAVSFIVLMGVSYLLIITTIKSRSSHD